jgi:hypothetical protein
MEIRVSGVTGEIRYGYHCAAKVGAWEVAERVLSAQIVDVCNTWWLTQAPLTFVFPRANGRVMTTPIEGLRVAGDTLTARLGPPERSTPHDTNASP